MSQKPWTCHSLTIIIKKTEMDPNLQEAEIMRFVTGVFEQASGIFWT